MSGASGSGCFSLNLADRPDHSYEDHEDQTDSTKVPSVLLYDSKGTLLACGWKALKMEIEGHSNSYYKVEW